MASHHAVRIESLNRDNFDTWKIQMEALLVKNDMWAYVTGEKRKPPIVTGDVSSATAAEAWEKEDRKAKSDIILGISPTELKRIKGCETSNEVWRKLQTIYQSTGPARKATLLKQLTLHRMDDGKDIREHLNLFFDTVDKLGEMEVEINNDLLTIMLLYSLPPCFENFRCAIESRDSLPTPEALRVKIVEEYDARKSDARTSTSNAMVAKGPRVKRRANLKQTSERDSKDNRCNKHSSKNDKTFKYKCHRCHEVGHKAADCKASLEEPAARKTDDVSLFVTSTEAPAQTAFEVKDNNTLETWCLDSGCSTHLCKDTRNFVKTSIVTGGKVSLANSASTDITAKGEISFAAEVNGRSKRVNVRDAFFVPELRTNLLSVSKIVDKGYTVTFDRNSGKVIDKEGNIALIADRIKDLYYLREAKSECNSAIERNEAYNSFELWHRRMGHLNVRDLAHGVRNGNLKGIDLGVPKNELDCEICIRGKMTRTPFPTTSARNSKLLEIVHTDVCGPMRVESNGRARYIVTFIDDYSRWCEIRLLKRKDEVLDAFKEYKAFAEKLTGKSIKYLQSDNGKEYRSNEFDRFLKEHGIGRRLTVTHTPEQNGVTERRNRTLVEMARCLLIQSGLPPSFWGEAINTANYIRNRCPSRSLGGKTSFEKWRNEVPDVRHLREFGCNVYTLDRNPNKSKFENRSKKGILVGYSEESKAYRVWIPEERRVDISRNVRFLEGDRIRIGNDFEDFCARDEKLSEDFDDREIELPFADREAETVPDDEESSSDQEESDDADTTSSRRGRGRPRLIRTGSRGRPKKQYHQAALADVDIELVNLAEVPVKEALQGAEADEWLAAMESEMKSIIASQTWTVVSRPEDREVIGSRFVLRNKYNGDGTLERRKARLVAKGYSQRPGVDFGDTFAPVARMSSIRMVAALAAQHQLSMSQFDVTTAYLNGELEEQIFMECPLKFEEILERVIDREKKGSRIHEASVDMLKEFRRGDKVLLLRKALYGLRQAGRRWHTKLSEILESYGFTRSNSDHCVFYLGRGEDILIAVVYVDDMIVASKNDQDISKLFDFLSTKFKVRNLGPIKYCLGIEFSQNQEIISLSQRGYLDDVLRRFGMLESKSVGSPLDPGARLKRGEEPVLMSRNFLIASWSEP